MNWFSLIKRIELNPTELCNLKCSFCPRGHGYPNSDLHMSLDIVREIRRQLDECNYKMYVTISGRGEPTLTKDFDKILDILFENNPSYLVRMNTNGKRLLKYAEYIPKFSEINLDAYDVDKEKAYNWPDEIIRHQNVKVKWKPDYGLDYGKWNKELNKPTAMSNRAGLLKSKDRTNCSGTVCSYPFEKMFINWNGDYNLCCDDWEVIKISNIYEESIPDYINHNRTLSKYREYHKLKQRSKLDICKTCDRVTKLSLPTRIAINEDPPVFK